MLTLIQSGLMPLPWWGYFVLFLITTQFSIFSVTIYLHRCQAHRALDLHAIPSHFFRFWLWFATGMETKAWVSIHRKHHAKVETQDDPHSPQIVGLKKVLLEGAELYRAESLNKETMERYGAGTPDDWMERNIYTKHSAMGVTLFLIIYLILFGAVGLLMWALQMAWIPFWAAGIVNGVAHYWGYRNFECQDASRNLIPIGFFIGGEELHNNHHTYGTSAKFSVKWWEVDMGWGVIRLLNMLGLAHPKRVPPKVTLQPGKNSIDIETVKGILTHRFQLMSNYSREVILPVLRQERKRASNIAMLPRVRKLLTRDTSLVTSKHQKQLENILDNSQQLKVVYQFRLKLQNIWARSTASQKELVEALQDWCKQAENSGVEALRKFVMHITAYVPA